LNIVTNQTALLFIIGQQTSLHNNEISLDGKRFIDKAKLSFTNRRKPVPGERAIHFGIFTLILIGLCSLSAWVSYTYLSGTLILEIAGIALSWGTILLVLYVSFTKLKWDWWTEKKAKQNEKS
jgi:hypothetical protein